MKLGKISSLLVISALFAASVSSCLGGDDNGSQVLVHSVESPDLKFNDKGVYEGVNNPSTDNSININGLAFSRNVNTTYQSFTGFQPSQVRDTVVPDNYWPDYQWGVVDLATPATNKFTFLVGYWDSSENTADIPQVPSCKVSPAYGVKTFSPLYVFVGNSAVAYKAMRYGLGVARPFTRDNDRFTLLIYGVRNGVRSQPVKVTLGLNQGGQPLLLGQWTSVDVSSLGAVEYLYFQMESTDVGEYGINTPTYFCYYGMQIKYEQQNQ